MKSESFNVFVLLYLLMSLFLTHSKTTKFTHYGGTAQNDYRVAAAVCQKNVGFGYIHQVLRLLGMLPTRRAHIYALASNRKRKLERKHSEMPATKRRRKAKKKTKKQSQETQEALEGINLW